MCGGAAKFEIATNITEDALAALALASTVYLIDLPVLAGSPSSWSSEKLIRLPNFCRDHMSSNFLEMKT
jgi:hypothetical protein